MHINIMNYDIKTIADILLKNAIDNLLHDLTKLFRKSYTHQVRRNDVRTL